MNKAAEIRRLWNETPLNREDIAEKLGCSLAYVRGTIWKMHKSRADYHLHWMRTKRQDPRYAAAELKRQRIRYHERKAKKANHVRPDAAE